MKIYALCLVIVIMQGCGLVARPSLPSDIGTIEQEIAKRQTAEHTADAAIKTSQDARAAADAARAEGRAAQAIADYKNYEVKRLMIEADTLRRTEISASISRWSWWLVAVGGCAACVGAVLAVWLRLASLLLISCAGAACLMLGIVGLWLAPAWIIVARIFGALCAIAFIGGLVYVIRKLVRTAHNAAAYGDTIEGAVKAVAARCEPDIKNTINQAIDMSKTIAASMQETSGIRTLLARIRKKNIANIPGKTAA